MLKHFLVYLSIYPFTTNFRVIRNKDMDGEIYRITGLAGFNISTPGHFLSDAAGTD
jgi:hypothetical protein